MKAATKKVSINHWVFDLYKQAYYKVNGKSHSNFQQQYVESTLQICEAIPGILKSEAGIESHEEMFKFFYDAIKRKTRPSFRYYRLDCFWKDIKEHLAKPVSPDFYRFKDVRTKPYLVWNAASWKAKDFLDLVIAVHLQVHKKYDYDYERSLYIMERKLESALKGYSARYIALSFVQQIAETKKDYLMITDLFANLPNAKPYDRNADYGKDYIIDANTTSDKLVACYNRGDDFRLLCQIGHEAFTSLHMQIAQVSEADAKREVFSILAHGLADYYNTDAAYALVNDNRFRETWEALINMDYPKHNIFAQTKEVAA